MNDAYEIAKKHNPGMIGIRCIEYDKYYCFNMVPEVNGAMFADSCTRRVNKRTGKYDLVHFEAMIGEHRIRSVEIINGKIEL